MVQGVVVFVVVVVVVVIVVVVVLLFCLFVLKGNFWRSVYIQVVQCLKFQNTLFSACHFATNLLLNPEMS